MHYVCVCFLKGEVPQSGRVRTAPPVGQKHGYSVSGVVLCAHRSSRRRPGVGLFQPRLRLRASCRLRPQGGATRDALSHWLQK